jgi:hypothetical protein
MVMHPPSKMERDSLEHRREEGANLEEMTSEEVEMIHDALSNVPLSSKHLISTGSSSTANISKHIVILRCTARVSAHEDLGNCCKFQIYEMCSSSSGDSLLCYGHGPTHHKMSTKLHTRKKKNHTYQKKRMIQWWWQSQKWVPTA